MKYDLIVLSEKSLDTYPSVLLSFADKVYLVNCPDQSQRIFREQKIRFAKLAHIFATTNLPSSIGGFQGLLITASECGNVGVTITGPSGLENILETYSQLHTVPTLRPKVIHSYTDNNIAVTEYPLSKTMAYGMKLCDIPGKFLVQKAKEMGLPPGPLYKKLSDGQTVEYNGTTIMPTDVIGPPIPGDQILFVDVRCDEDFGIISQINMEEYDFVVHFTPEHIVKTDKYHQIFCSIEKHIYFPQAAHIAFNSVSSLYNDVTKLSPLFKPLSMWNTNTDKISWMHEAKAGLFFQFAPVEKKRFIPPAPPAVSVPFFENRGEIPQKTDSLVITFLGTGSMCPSKYRNVTGILIQCRTGYIVLDGGEGFVGQLRRRFGEGADSILENIKLVFVTHSHGDHVFGLPDLLYARAKLTDVDVPVCAPECVLKHLSSFESANIDTFGPLKYLPRAHEEKQSVGPISLEPIPVRHNLGAKGCAIDLPGGFRVAFSGDRGGNDGFGERVGHCDVLIHEATFSNDLIETATDKRHSTIGMAMETAREAHADHVILTHFSQRYPKLPAGTGEGAIFAFDYLTVALEEAEQLAALCPAVFQMLVEREEAEKDDAN